ncbi:MAG TPA: nitroreductase family protein [Candidatus Dormibacteraeota bacterium]|nr:nitroreductase family protein [Candidatus Dormibacteraeota bacterium]
MELSQAMRTTASTRLFGPGPVSDELLHRVLDDARFAPSGGNRQGWRVVVVRDAERRARLQELYLRSWRPYHEELARRAPDDAARRRLAAANHYAEHLADLPVHLVVTVDLAALLITDARLDRPSIIGGASIYPFVHNVLLGLRAAGLGASLTTLIVPQEAEVKELLEIPDGFAVAAHIGVGRPARGLPTRLRRRPVEEFATVDRFTGPPLRPGPAGD